MVYLYDASNHYRMRLELLHYLERFDGLIWIGWHFGQKLVQELKTDGAKKEINLQSQDIGDAQVQVRLERRFVLRRHVVDLPGARRSVEDEQEHHPHQPWIK